MIDSMFRVRKFVKPVGMLVLSLVLLSAPLLAQAPGGGAPASPEQPVTTIKATTRVVQVSVVVRDKNGQPVSGLTRDDFTLLDKGDPQKVALFAQEGGTQPVVAPKPLPAGIYTNRLQMKGQVPGNVTVVLFDTLNTRLEDQSYARSQVIKFLERLQPQDHIAVYALTTKLEILHDFTQDTSVLIAAVARYKGLPSGQLSASENPQADMNRVGPRLPQGASATGAAQLQGIQQLFNSAQQRQQDMAAVNRAEATMSAIEAIAHHLAPIPGRKNLVWISGSFPLAVGEEGPNQKDPTRELRTFERRLERTTRALNQANLAIYPVDARGLMGSASYGAVDIQRSNLGQDPDLKPERDTNDFAAMDLMAERTGGRSFHNNNDLSSVVRTALADAEVTYQLGFYPSHGRWDGKYHEIKVRVDRPGVELHYRKGYFATPEPTDTEAERKAEINAAVESPIEATNLSILAQLYAPEKDIPDQFPLGLMLNAKEIEFQDTPTGRHCALDFVVVQRDATGKQLGGEQKHAEFSPDEKKYESLLQTGMLVTDHVKLRRGVAELKIVVRDARSGSLGSVVVPLKNGPKN
jgi:VWFA-related protein